MRYIELQKKVESLYELIKSGYKASPSEFASKINTPLRSYYRVLAVMKEKYGEVEYDRTLKKYVFLEK